MMTAMSPAAEPSPDATIEGVQVVPLRRIPDERGTIFHMLRRTDPHFVEFGEIYFSTIYRGVVKGWHRHARMTLNYACIAGRIKLVLYDDRMDSPTRGSLDRALPRPRRLRPCGHPARHLDGVQGHGRRIDDRELCVASTRSHGHRTARPVRRRDPL